ncbi:MAG TPA: DNA helicase RecQ [Pyrinomonadaceae bacterium]|nr:DNA helicase RecQ [Pyrinomonadaceae bacterium]
MNSPTQNLLVLLKENFGFDSFRPLQEEIVRDALADRDVFALLPTGAGKSLCFQLPALARSGLTVVVSPLISLMKDQVDALTASGIAATFLNSTLPASEIAGRMRDLRAGEYRLLYVAPERLMLPAFLSNLRDWPIGLIAIDEAHCISEWGHDFRPEYRQLAQLRELFPRTPLMALTATATRRVQGDIIKQLRLRDPSCYVASFNRPNLTYRVQAKDGAYKQLLRFVKAHEQDSGIVYCQSRNTAESLSLRLNADGIKAEPYHAGLEGARRNRNQESFLRDDVQVICATIAFGMGINKPNVRFVVHYDLPKNIEGYYQETGRAGRDGLPSECLLLFSAGDSVKYSRFIDEVSNPQERDIARQQLRQMVQLAESAECRRVALLRYFGEEFSDHDCRACDNCLTPRETYDGTLEAQKFLSCVYRLREKSRIDFGINQIAEVLTGADTDKVRKWEHQHVSTYGIGKERSQNEWRLIGRELVRLGLLKQLPDKFNVLQLSESGWTALKQRQPILLVKPIVTPKESRRRDDKRKSDLGAAFDYDEALFDRLRRVRKTIADQLSVPAYIVFSDVSLRQMARYYPTTEREFAQISGVGAKKLADFGGPFIEAIAGFLREHQRRSFD